VNKIGEGVHALLLARDEASPGGGRVRDKWPRDGCTGIALRSGAHTCRCAFDAATRKFRLI